MVNNLASRLGLLDSVAKALNIGGRAVVSVYDTGSDLVEKIFSTVSQVTVLPEKAMDLAERLRPGEKRGIEKEIKAYQARIKELYYEIGRLEAGLPESAEPSERDPLKRLIAEVREYEQEIEKLNTRLAEIEAAQAKVVESERMSAEANVMKSVNIAIEEGLKSGVFANPGDKALFERVAKNLFDDDSGVRLLAVAELGKFGNKACVPVLISAAGFESPELQYEIIGMLVSIGDKQAVSLLKEKLSSPSYRVKTGCLRGLYRLADNEQLIPLLTGALSDSHPDVRVTAATLLGWKGNPAAVTALSLCLKDREEAVRKAAISALANIGDSNAVLPLIKVLGDRSIEIRKKALEAIRSLSGQDLSLDVQAKGKALSEAINQLKEKWWRREAGKTQGGSDIEVEAQAGVPDEDRSDSAEGPDATVEVPVVDESLASLLSEPLKEIEEAESPEEEEGVEEEPGGEVDNLLSESKLKKMLRADLVALCKELGVECDETFTKAEMIKLLISK